MKHWLTALIFFISFLLLGGSVFLLASDEKTSDEKTSNDNKEDSIEADNVAPWEGGEESRSTTGEGGFNAETTGELPTNNKCGYAQEGNLYYIEATCVLQGKIPQLSTKDIVDLLRDDIETFDEIYQPFETTSTYYGSNPLFKSDFDSLLNGSFEANEQLIQLAKQREQIWFTKQELARYRANDLAFYVSDKDISKLSRCNTQNYTLALQKIDSYLLKPGESFNANRELAKVRGYCTGRGEKNFLFYGGVCGMSAQVFRTAIIHPAIEITKRRPHNERFVQYYGAEVGGDDAAIYEMSKQFEIKNNGEEDIYFKVKRGSGHNLLVAISPRNNQRVEITKHPINALKIDLERTIREATETENTPLLDTILLPTQQQEKMLNQETFHSTYIKKNYELR